MKSITDIKKIRLQKIQSVSVTPEDVLRFYAEVKYDLNDYSYTKINSYLKGQPVAENIIFKWDYIGGFTPKSVVLKISLNDDMRESLVYNIEPQNNTYNVRNLCADTVYYWQIEAVNSDECKIYSDVGYFKTLIGRRILSFDVVKNFRDLGGIKTLSGNKIKQGLLFRGGQIDTDERYLTDRDLMDMRNLLKIKTELDLRKPEQLVCSSNGKSPIGDDVNYIHLSAVEYNNFVSGNTNEQQIMRIFTDFANYPIFFHCQYGADRTGTVAFLLEALVGVDMQELTKDYELTQWQNRKHIPFTQLVNVGCGGAVGDELRQKVIRIFIEKFAFTQMEISNIYNILITDGAVFESDSLKEPCFVGENFVEYRINMRKSQFVKSVTNRGNDTNFEYSGGILRIFSDLDTKIYGEIVFDDVSLKYEYNPEIIFGVKQYE